MLCQYFFKEDNFCDFLFCVSEQQSPSKMGATLKGDFFYLKRQLGEKDLVINDGVASPESTPIHMKFQ